MMSLKDPVARKAYQKSYRDAHRAGKLGRDRLKKYGLTEREVSEYLDAQDGRCLICGKPPKPGKVLHVDHNHRTGQIRGFLCVQCNVRLVAVEDREWLRNARKYLALYAGLAEVA